MKPFLLSKTTSQSKITLVENDEVINDDTRAAETLNSFFTEAVLNLEFQNTKLHPLCWITMNKDIDRIVEKYQHHPSVTAIKQALPELSFSFKPVRVIVRRGVKTPPFQKQPSQFG